MLAEFCGAREIICSATFSTWFRPYYVRLAQKLVSLNKRACFLSFLLKGLGLKCAESAEGYGFSWLGEHGF
jgi:hypothetical protein